MLEVFDLLCNGSRDPVDVCGAIRLSWRLGSDRMGANQASYRVVVVSLSSGDVLWDTGVVPSDSNAVTYGGASQPAGEACTWFVTVTDDAGDTTQSVPVAFVWGARDGRPAKGQPPQRLGFVWCSDEDANRAWESRDACDLGEGMWHDVLGVRASGLDARKIAIEPDLNAPYSFVQGSLLLSRGLLVVRWERGGDGVRVGVSIPPGVRGDLVVAGECWALTSGRHTLEVVLR